MDTEDNIRCQLSSEANNKHFCFYQNILFKLITLKMFINFNEL